MEAFTVIFCQVLLAVLTRKIPTFRTIAIGIFLTSVSWMILTLPIPAGQITLHLGFTAPTFYRASLYVAVTLFVLALGEILLSSRYYDYISRLAPAGQEGLYMGYAFLPIAIGYFIGGPLGGYLLHYFGDLRHEAQYMWYVIAGIGVFATLLMWVYDRAFKPPMESVAP